MAPERRASARERLPSAAIRLSVDRPILVILGWCAIVALTIPALLRLTVEASTESVLDKRSPMWFAYQESMDTFGGDEVLVVAIRSDTPFSPEAIREVERLSTSFEGLEGVRRVDSLSTHPIIRANDSGDLLLSSATENSIRDGVVDADEIRRLARYDRIAPRNLVSEDGRTLAVNLILEPEPSAYYESILGVVRGEVGHATKLGLAVRVSGVPVFQWETSRNTRNELVTFGPACLALIGSLVALLLGTFRAAAFIVATGGAATLIMLAAISSLGVRVSFPMVVLPPVILALAAAYGMHMLTASVSGSREAESTEPPADHLWRKLVVVAEPLTLSGVTTSIGFVSASLVGIEAVRNVGAFGAIGVIATVAATLTLLPACLAIFPLPPRRLRAHSWISNELAPQLGALARASSHVAFSIWIAATALACVGVSKVIVDTDATRWFKNGTNVRDDYVAIRSELSGISPINVVVHSDPADGQRKSLVAPSALNKLDELAAFLVEKNAVGKAVSIVDPISQLHQSFADDDSTLPTSLGASEQYLLMLESVEQIDDLVSDDRQSANVAVRLDNNGSSEILRVGREAEKWWEINGLKGTSAFATGVMWEFARAQDQIARGQIVGLSIALLSISLVLLATFRNLRVALATLIPNVLPLVLIFGAMGIIGVPLDAGTVLVGSLALGIAVDDTIHLTSAFFSADRADDAEAALDSALAVVASPIIFTTVAVGTGFLVLAASDFTFIQNLGLLMGSVMTICLLADLHLLPPLLLRYARDRARE